MAVICEHLSFPRIRASIREVARDINSVYNMAAAMDSGISNSSEASGLRQRYVPETSECDSELPYGGKVFLARKKSRDPTHIRVIEVDIWHLFSLNLCCY